MKILDLFSGIGGFSLAAHWLGWQTAAFVERDEFCQKVLRKNFGEIPIYNDITTFSGKPFRGTIDIITGGFPCQPFSAAGKRAGRKDERHLFPQMLRVISEIKPRWIVAENVRGLLSIESGRLFSEIIASLEGEGYEVITFCVPASAVNAPHRRDRLWIIAHLTDAASKRIDRRGAKRNGRAESENGHFGTSSNSDRKGLQRRDERTDRAGQSKARFGLRDSSAWQGHWLEAATRLCGVSYGFSEWLDIFRGVDYGQKIKTISRQNLSDLRQNLQSGEVWKELRGRFQIFEQENLFSVLRQFEIESEGQNDVSFSCEEIAETILRDVRHSAESGCAPQGWRHYEQYKRECSDALSSLSYEIALATESLVWKWKKESARDNRTNRLKALGNSIVPQIAFEVFRAIEESEKNL